MIFHYLWYKAIHLVKNSIMETESSVLNSQVPQNVIYSSLQVTLVVKNPPANVRGSGVVGWIPGSTRSLGEEQGNSLQYSCLENPMDRGAWQTTVHRVAKNRHD